MNHKYIFVMLLAMILFTGLVNGELIRFNTTNTTDGIISRAIHNTTWADVHDGAGNVLGITGSAYEDIKVYSDYQANSMWSNQRGVFIFNTSTLPDNAIISDAKIGIYRRTSNVLLGDTGITFTRFNIDGSITVDDYDNYNNDLFSPYQNLSSFTAGRYYNWSLNSLGISNISKTDLTGFMGKTQFDIENTAPTWSSYTYTRYSFYTSENINNIPFLEITYTIPTPTPTPTPTATATTISDICSIPEPTLTNSTLIVCDITEDSIRWGYTANIPILYVALDGKILRKFDNQSHYYRAGELTQNATHTFCLYLDNETNCEPAITSSIESEEKTFFSFFNFWIYGFFALLFVVVAVFTGVPFIALAGSVCAFIGIVASIGNSFVTGLLFVLIFIITLFIGLRLD